MKLTGTKTTKRNRNGSTKRGTMKNERIKKTEKASNMRMSWKNIFRICVQNEKFTKKKRSNNEKKKNVLHVYLLSL